MEFKTEKSIRPPFMLKPNCHTHAKPHLSTRINQLRVCNETPEHLKKDGEELCQERFYKDWTTVELPAGVDLL